MDYPFMWAVIKEIEKKFLKKLCLRFTNANWASLLTEVWTLFSGLKESKGIWSQLYEINHSWTCLWCTSKEFTLLSVSIVTQSKHLIEQSSVLSFFGVTGCGVVNNNTLTSPGYPDNYPSDTDCLSFIPIPQNTQMKIYFDKFDLEDSNHCR